MFIFSSYLKFTNIILLTKVNYTIQVNFTNIILLIKVNHDI